MLTSWIAGAVFVKHPLKSFTQLKITLCAPHLERSSDIGWQPELNGYLRRSAWGSMQSGQRRHVVR